MEESALYRNPTGDFFAGDFKPNPFQYLLVKKITSRMLEDQFYCTFLCVAEPKCYSFNMAAYPDSKGLYFCELLATDKYRETKKFHANATFHHYSPWVRFLYQTYNFSAFLSIQVLTSCRLTLFNIFSLHVKVTLARTVLTVFLNMN